MKKILLLLVGLLTSAGIAIGQNVLSVGDFTMPQNGCAMTLTLTLDEENVYTGYQFKIETPVGMGFVMDGDNDVECVLGTGHVSSHSATAHWNNSERLLTVAVASTKSALFSGQTVVLEIPMAATTAEVGTTHDFTITNISFIKQENAVKVNLSDVPFTVTIGAPADLRTILDETSTNAPEDAADVNVLVRRTIKANEWSTICLPFDMSEAQVKSAFGDDVLLADFTGCDATEDTDDNTIELTVKFIDATAIAANHPYIIKVSSAITEFTVDGVDIVVEDEPSVDMDEYRTGSGTKKDPYVYHYNSFVGTYVANTTVPDLSMFLSENKFWYSKGNTKMKGFRAYFDFYDVLTSVESASTRISMSISNESTGIKDKMCETKNNNRFYNLNGQRVYASKKGIYIRNGKKEIIK